MSSLASRLQELSNTFRKSQSNYLKSKEVLQVLKKQTFFLDPILNLISNTMWYRPTIISLTVWEVQEVHADSGAYGG